MIGVSQRPTGGTGAPTRRPRRGWMIGGGLLLVLALLGWLVAVSSVLGVRSVQISGTRLVTADQVRAAAGIATGTPLIRLDTAGIRQRIEALPAVRTVTVTKSYPSRVNISVTERTAVGYRVRGSEVTWVDGEDVAFRTWTHRPAGRPQLDLVSDVARSAAIAQVAGSLSAQVAAKVALIAAPSTESVTLTLTNGRTVLWGGTDRDLDKARLLPVLMTQPGTYFDVSDPSSVISRGAAAAGN